MKIKTEILQKLVSKSIQGASANRMIPLTSLIGIEAKGDILTLTTTDGSNTFKVNQNIEVDGQIAVSNEFYTIVNADTFAKLVGKTTKEFIELDNKENYLEIKGNGTYKLEIAINEEGEMVRFPDIKDGGIELAVNLKYLQEAIKVAKSSVAKTMEVPCLTGYYISNNMITTDRQLVCKLDKELITEPILISSEMAELLLLVEGDEVLELLKDDNNLIFYNANYTIAGKELEGKELYPVQPIENLTNLSYNNSIKVNKQELLSVLDRMALFVTDYDKNGISLVFAKDGLCVTSQKSNAQELIDAECTSEEEYNCLVDIEMLKSQIETISTDEVEIQYGQDKSIKIVDGNCTHIISLLEKSN